MKSKNKIFLYASLLLLIITIYYVAPSLFKNANEPLTNKVAELSVRSNDLINAFIINEKQSNEKYAGKIIEVFGTVREINHLNNRTTIILDNKENTFGILCDINPLESKKVDQIKNNQRILVKGICKGYLKDVILLNCSIEVLADE